MAKEKKPQKKVEEKLPAEGVGQNVTKVCHVKRLKKMWRSETKGYVSLKTWANKVLETGEPEFAVDYAAQWLEQKALSRMSIKKFKAMR